MRLVVPRMPKGTIGFRWQTEKGKWNLEMKDGVTDEDLDPELSFVGRHDAVVQVAFDDFAGGNEVRDVFRQYIDLCHGAPPFYLLRYDSFARLDRSYR